MWISKVVIKNFRKIPFDKKVVIGFKEGLNLIIGENNIGKTTIIDAVSLCLNYGSVERGVWLRKEDFNNPDSPIEILMEFSGLKPQHEAAFLQALVIDDEAKNNQLRFIFSFELKDEKVQSQIKCGELGLTSNPYDLLKYLRGIHLQALRDVNLEFQPGYKSRITKIVKKEFPDSKSFEEIFKEANKKALEHQGEKNPVTILEGQTNQNIVKLSLGSDNNKIKLDFVEQEFTKILTNIIMKTAEKGLDIKTNGLGYNNLIYISTILTELKVEEKYESHIFNCLLIEEPEAHLHPQLQALLLDFLQTEYKAIQVILTSHSPSLAAAVNFDNLTILAKSQDIMKSVLIKNTTLENKNKAFLRRFLDVTKSQMFFARKIIFVEGVTEAMLMKTFWNYIFKDIEMKFDRQGIEIVNIQGVAFKPYVDLIKNVFAETDVRAVLITDDDRGSGRNCPIDKRFVTNDQIRPTQEIVNIFNDAPISSRAAALMSDVDKLKKEGFRVGIFLSRKTFEIEFALTNEKIRKLFNSLIPMAESSTMPQLNFAIDIWRKISDENLKSEFADRILRFLGRASNKNLGIQIPDYIIQAFNFLKDD